MGPQRKRAGPQPNPEMDGMQRRESNRGEAKGRRPLPPGSEAVESAAAPPPGQVLRQRQRQKGGRPGRFRAAIYCCDDWGGGGR